jgi:hypothetical protein
MKRTIFTILGIAILAVTGLAVTACHHPGAWHDGPWDRAETQRRIDYVKARPLPIE